MPKVSIIIPTYNRKGIIEKAIQSALNQTIKNIEILVCDDGSTDNTEKIVKEIIQKDNRVKWIKGSHSGKPAIPRNKGIKNAKGEWIAFLDSDDEWLPNKLEEQLKVLKKTGLKASSTNAYLHIVKKNKTKIYHKKDWKKIKFKDLLKLNRIICSSVVIHKSVIKKIGLFPTEKYITTGEDYAFWLRVSTQENFMFIKEPLLVFNHGTKNSIGVKNNGKIKNIQKYLIQQKNILKNFTEWIKNRKDKNGTLPLFYKIYFWYGKIFRYPF